jgi:hypothetical protein
VYSGTLPDSLFAPAADSVMASLFGPIAVREAVRL